MGSHGIDLDDGHLGNGGAEAHGEKVQPGAEHQHAIGLVHHAPTHGVEKNSQDAQVVRMAVEHVLAARRGHQQGAGLLRQRLQRRLRPGSISAHAGHDHGTPALAEESRGGVDRLATHARWLAGSGELWRGRPPDLHVHHLYVGGQEQGGQSSVAGGGYGVDQGLARGCPLAAVKQVNPAALSTAWALKPL